MTAVTRRGLPHPAVLAVDIALTLCFAAGGALRELVRPVPPSRLVEASIACYIAVHVVAAALLLRRRQNPLLMGSGVALLSVLTPTAITMAAAYAVGVYSRERRWKWVVLAALLGCWSLGAGVWAMARTKDALIGPGLVVLAGLLGLYVGARRRLMVALTDRAERAERERELIAEQTRAEERTQLAGEMHDVVTHRINLMVLQAGALRVSVEDEGVRQAAEELRLAGCQALAELRDLVGVLRSDRTPGTATLVDGAQHDLAGLVAESEAVDVAVRLTEHGDPEPATPTVRRAVYRVVQESLTNVRKHAPGSAAGVTVCYESAEVRITVRNSTPARPADVDLRDAGGGTGLQGLRQRVEMLGGTLTAEATADGGFRVDATLPAYLPTDEVRV